jgi:tetratricopeptide (TPR) repeat protein
MTLAFVSTLVSVMAVQAPPQPSYAALIDAYRSGQCARAVADFKARTDQAIVHESVRWIEAMDRVKDARQLEVALMLHTEVAFDVMDANFIRKPSDVLGGVTGALDRVKELHSRLAAYDRRSSFLRNWYLLWESYLQARNAPTGGVPNSDYMGHALQAFPDDPEILLMAGSAKELIWWMTSDNPQRRPDGKSGTGERALREARDYFRKAAATGVGSLDEAHLRLGRTLIVLQEYDAARAELEPLQALPGNASLSYLANVFLGDLHERRDDLTAAAADYDAAMRLVPFGQSAQLAAAHVAHRTSARATAADLATRASSNAPAQADPWWWYIRGQAWQLDPRLDAARRAVKQ